MTEITGDYIKKVFTEVIREYEKKPELTEKVNSLISLYNSAIMGSYYFLFSDNTIYNERFDLKKHIDEYLKRGIDEQEFLNKMDGNCNIKKTIRGKQETKTKPL